MALLKAFEGQEPKVALGHLSEIFGILRPSGGEKDVRQYIRNWAEPRGYRFTEDKFGNCSVFIPPTKGCEGVAPVCLQTHMDMVYLSDPHVIEAEVVDGWIQSVGQKTTIGLDNAGGMTLAMDVAETAMVHGPIFLLFTADEEDNMTGCTNWNPADHGMENCSMMINVDTPKGGVIGTFCAGFQDVVGTLEISYEPLSVEHCFKLELAGFSGGHSGDNVVENRGNPLKTLGEMFQLLPQGWQLVSVSGGEKGNSLPVAATAVVSVQTLSNLWQQELQLVAELTRMALNNRDITFRITQCGSRIPFTRETQASVVRALSLIRSGVVEMSSTVAFLPILSTTLAIVKEQDDILTFQSIVRGADGTRMSALAETVKIALELCGFEAEYGSGANGWLGSTDSSLTKAIVRSYEKIGVKPAFVGFHCTLETGPLFGSVASPHFSQIASIGPTVLDEHASTERGDLASMVMTRTVLIDVLDQVAQGV